MEVSVINTYILYVVGCQKNNYNPMSHTKFRWQLAVTLVWDFQQGGGLSTRGRHFTSAQERRVNGKLCVIIPHPGGKHKDCRVCSKRSVLGDRRESTYIVETYERQPGPCGNVLQKITHWRILNCKMHVRHSRRNTNSHFCWNFICMPLNWLIYKHTSNRDYLGINLDQTAGIHEKNVVPIGLL